MTTKPLKSKENNYNYGPGQDPQSMAQTIADQNGIITQLTGTITGLQDFINKMENTMSNLNKEIEKFKEKIKQLENELQNEKKLRSENLSDSSNSPPLVKK